MQKLNLEGVDLRDRREGDVQCPECHTHLVSSGPNRAARFGIDPRKGGEQPLRTGSWSPDCLGLMLRLEADITLPYVTSLSGSIAVYGGELGFVEWPLDES